jgi:hypothetical protein
VSVRLEICPVLPAADQSCATLRGSHGCDYEDCDMRAETRIVEPKATAVAKERPINAFPPQRRRHEALEELLGTVFSTGAPRGCIARLSSRCTRS